ncbi:MAG: 50S ribosomal protein L18 [Owenweeksia sp.]
MALTKSERRQRIKKRIRKTVTGTAEKPRLSVFRSNNEIYAQIIDDVAGKTLMAASSLEKEFSKEGNRSEVAKKVGQHIAAKAKEAGLEQVAFDRNGYLYHGRVRSLAEGAREGGLKF